MDNISSVDASQKSKNKFNVKGTVAGYGAGALASLGVSSLAFIPVEIMSKFSKGLTKDEINIVNNNADNIVSNITNLGKKGVKIINETENSGFNVFDISSFKLPEKLKEAFNIQYATSKGKNAFFAGKDLFGNIINEVHINKEKLPLAVFHELGHAFNYNNSSFWKAMQKSRTSGMAIAGLISMIPLLTKEEKAQDGKELTKGQKFKNGLRKASPLLSFVSMTPMLSEEAMASFRGCKWAHNLLDKNLFKKVAKTNAVAYTAYLLSALGFATFAFVGMKVKDNMQTKKEINKV